MSFLELIPTPTWRDLIDILFLTIVAYHLYIWFRETRALRVLIGLAVLGGVYSLAKLWGLFLTTKVFQILWQVLLILLLILFQSEIKQVLEKVSLLQYLRSRKRRLSGVFALELAKVAFELAKEKTGALIVLTREDNPAEFIHSGQSVMATPSAALIKSIFNHHSPTHDGGIIIADDRLTQMGCILPLSESQKLPEFYGTRHRAALGISEVTDAVCLVVSEERSEVTTIENSNIAKWETPELLAEQLKKWLGMPDGIGFTFKKSLKGYVQQDWKPKLGALCLVTIAWLFLASQQDIQVPINAPINYINLPADLVLDQSSAATVRLNLSGRRKNIAAIRDQDVRVQLDLSSLRAGEHSIRLSRKNVDLPLGVTIDSVIPQDVKIILKQPAPNPDPSSIE
jgi:diadenylate cyclase